MSDKPTIEDIERMIGVYGNVNLSGRVHLLEDVLLIESLQADKERLEKKVVSYRAHRNDLSKEIKRLEAKLKNTTEDAVRMLMPDCDKHTGHKTPPLSEFIDKYCGRCAVCDDAHIDKLEAEIASLEISAAERRREVIKLREEEIHLNALLDRLVQLKDHKDKHGKDAHYVQEQPQAWEAARNRGEKP